MRILVTGAVGFIGQHLTNKLLERQYKDLFICDKRAQGQPHAVQELEAEDLHDPDVIIHLAATARVGVSLQDPAGVITNNVQSTLRLLEYCRYRPNTRLIVVSSSSVKHAELSRNPYALSKSMCEQMVEMYRNTYQVKACVVRLFNVYGPGEADYGKHTTLLKQCKKGYLSGKGFYIDGDGSIVRDYTHVDDVCEGFIDVMLDESGNQLYELGSGNATVTVKQIVEEFQRNTNLPIEYRQSRFGDPLYTCASPNPTLTWSPKIDVLDYIRQWKADGCKDD